jgi:hypothetical protein
MFYGDEIVNIWAQSIKRRSPELMASMYSNDAVLLATFTNLIEGKQGIREYFQDFLNREDLQCTITKNVTQLDYDRDTTISSGLYTFSFREYGQLVNVKARYTFAVNENKIITHHSSLEPE